MLRCTRVCRFTAITVCAKVLSLARDLEAEARHRERPEACLPAEASHVIGTHRQTREDVHLLQMAEFLVLDEALRQTVDRRRDADFRGSSAARYRSKVVGGTGEFTS